MKYLHRAISSLIVCLMAAVLVPGAHADQHILASHEDAYVLRDTATGEWAIGTGGLQLVIGFNRQGTLSLPRLWNPDDGHVTTILAEPVATITLDDREVLLQQAGDHSTFVAAAAGETDAGVQLSLSFEHRRTRAIITRSFAAYPGSSTVEVWTDVQVPGAAPAVRVSNMVGWQLTMANASVRWVNGLRDAGANRDLDASFTIERGVLEDGAHIEIGSSRRSTEAFLPLIVVEGTDETFFGGVIWSGAWRIAADRFGEAMYLRADFPVATYASSGQPVEFPHSFFGIADPSPGSETRALRQFVMRGIRKGRPFRPLVTYNTWFAYGSRIAQSAAEAEIDLAAGVGAELFVLDAGWYEGAGMEHPFDFTSGLGNWRVDPERFHSGLKHLADYAHGFGVKFGLWVEPERIALSTLLEPNLAREQWLATQNGEYGDTQSAQLCLASEEARQWVFGRLIELVDQVRPDYLKWDNNFWVNCDRSGHDHDEGDGNYRHVVALYGMLAELRQRYPDMLIENVSGGGNRLDYALLAYTDVGWMDDRTAPSDHVRHNFEGLALAFPPAYLLSFVIDSEVEPLVGAADFGNIARSRMPGILGVTYRYQQVEIDADLLGALRLGIEQYKSFRHITSEAYALLLTQQAPVGAGWDVVEEITEDRRTALIFAFKGTADPGSLLVHPRRLNAEATYDVRSLDAGHFGRFTGSQLMSDGLVINHGSGSRAHLIFVTQISD